MSLTVYHLKNCDTCKKAIKTLQGAGHELALLDVRTDGMPDNILRDIVNIHGWETVLNRRSTTWRNLDETQKSISAPEQAVDLMRTYPTLIKRPVIISAETSTIGWAGSVQDVWL